MTQILSKRHRSVLAQFRCGILPFKIEIGRFDIILVELRLCEMCDLNSIEDETHFFLYCSLYFSFRFFLYDKAIHCFPEFPEMIDELKLRVLMEHPALVKARARYLEFRTRTLSSDVSWRNWHIETGILVTVIAVWYVNCFVYFLLTHTCMIV